MKASTQEKVLRIKDALTKDNLVFIRVAGSPREYAVDGCRNLQQNIEFTMRNNQRLVVSTEELGVVRIVEVEDD